MAKKTNKNEAIITELGKLIPDYVEVKKAFDDFKKKEAELNKKIKQLMAETTLDKWSWETDDAIVEYSTRESDVYDEDGVLDYMHKHKAFQPCIKTKEYFDAEVLEDLMYKGEISKKLQIGLDAYRTSKTTQVLKIKAVKKGK